MGSGVVFFGLRGPWSIFSEMSPGKSPIPTQFPRLALGRGVGKGSLAAGAGSWSGTGGNWVKPTLGSQDVAGVGLSTIN